MSAADDALNELVEAVRPLLETIIEKQHRTRWAGHYVAMEDLDGPFRRAFGGVIRANRIREETPGAALTRRGIEEMQSRASVVGGGKTDAHE